MKAYEIIKEIPFSSLKYYSIIKEIDGKFYYKQMEIPFFNEKIVREYCKPIQIYEQEIKLHSIVLFKKTKSTRELTKASVIDFNELTNKYKIEYKEQNKKKEKWINSNEITIPEKYYFLSSKGIVQDDYTYRDEQAEHWRKITGNYFLNKEDCQKYREKLINSSI